MYAGKSTDDESTQDVEMRGVPSAKQKNNLSDVNCSLGGRVHTLCVQCGVAVVRDLFSTVINACTQ